METAQLLNLDAQILLNCLTRADNGWSSVENGLDADWDSANRTRNSLCRIMYGRLFTWVVNRINDLLKSKLTLRGSNFGVLDFYGFENFEFNSFEQLIINYCDERKLFIAYRNIKISFNLLQFVRCDRCPSALYAKHIEISTGTIFKRGVGVDQSGIFR